MPFTRCRYCRTPPAHRCPQQRQRRRRRQRQRVTEGTAMAPWNGPNNSAQELHAITVHKTTVLAVAQSSLEAVTRMPTHCACPQSDGRRSKRNRLGHFRWSYIGHMMVQLTPLTVLGQSTYWSIIYGHRPPSRVDESASRPACWPAKLRPSSIANKHGRR